MARTLDGNRQPPGALHQPQHPDVIMMLCTSGHVDHGKTSLVKLLTGCSTDRLKSEQERGLTIELGFAPCVLGNDLCVGIVDVPGHEKFIKNMVAGVSGIAMTILVIAADDGIMQQTIEHFQIMELLGVHHGIVALTKTDLVAEDCVQQRIEEIRGFLKGTFMAEAPICPLSSETGEGVFEFYDILVNEIQGLSRSWRPGVFRMPVERSFAQKGFGMVVTGIPVAGAITVGAQVEVVPGHRQGRVRGIQRFLRDASEGGYGQCLALNVPEFSKNPPRRGQVVSVPGYLSPATCFHGRIRAIPNLDHPLKNAESIKFHTGTSEENGKLYLLEDSSLDAGQTALATIVVSNPVPAAVHDHFIIRRTSPMSTIAGGQILEITEGARRPRKKEIVRQLESHLAFFGAQHGVLGLHDSAFLDKHVAYVLRSGPAPGAVPKTISAKAMLSSAEVETCLARLLESKTLLVMDDQYYVHKERYVACYDEIVSRMEEAREQPGVMSLPVQELQKGLDWPATLWRCIIGDLERNALVHARGDKLLFPSAADGLSDEERRLLDAMLHLYEETGFHSPRPSELPERLEAEPAMAERLLAHLCDTGQLIRLGKNVVLCYDSLRTAQEMAIRIIEENGVLDSSDFKQHIESSRKYALAILDYLDSRGVTVRFQNDRKLSPNYGEKLL